MIDTDKFDVIDGFVLETADKLERVVMGDMQRNGLVGGVGEDADPALVLARYDRIAGLITKDGTRIKTGSFWDFKAGVPRETPEIMFSYNIGGDIVDVADPAELGKAIQTLETARSKKETEFKEKKARAKAKRGDTE